MGRLAIISFLLASLLYPAQRKRNSPKPPELQVAEVTARRGEGTVSLDGRVRNCGEKALRGLKLLFDFMDSDRQVLTTKNWTNEDAILQPGDETEFHAQLTDPVRAVYFRVNAEDGGGRELRVDKGGPFPVE